MSEDKQPLPLCPKCGLPFKTEDSLSSHVANWHSEGPNRKRATQKPAGLAQLLWRNLVHRVFETPEGFLGLSEPEKRYYAVGILEGEVFNGGFHQYFFDL